jgi:hypothetical protein
MKIIVAIFVLMLAGNMTFAQTPSANEIRIIMLKDEGGFGVDKGFEFLLEQNDVATFHGGRNFYGRKGDYAGAFTEKQFAHLAQLIINNNFFALRDRYEGTTMDVGTRTITVVYGGKQKTVVNWGASDVKEFAAIEKALRELEAKINWRSPLKTGDEQLESFTDLRAFNLDDAQTKLGSENFAVEKNVGYERLQNLTSFTDKTGETPTLFFQGERQVLLYLNAEMLAARELTPEYLYRKFGKRYVQLRSRAGKTHRQIVYPSQGIAFSTGGASLDFLEIFPPTTLARYRREIYRTPSAFIR